ncbi:MAG: GGDEF domain-containing protein [Saccharofermentanales bacterium]
MKQEEFYLKMLENMYDGIYFVDKERRIIFWNKGAEIITGFTEAEVKGHFCYDNILNHVDSEGCELCWNGCPLQKTNEDGITRETSIFLHHKQGHRIPVSVRAAAIYDGDEIIGSIEIFRDESESNKILEHLGELRSLALNDPLTGLPNRRYIESFMDSKVNEYRTLGIPFGIAFMDIDKFKDFNDRFGHDAGDDVLKMVAKTYMNVVRSNDLIGRWGGEEFVAVLAGVSDDSLFAISEKIRLMIEKSSIMKDGETLTVSISIGAAMFRQDDSIESVLKRADTLLYKSKMSGRNKVTLA